MCSPRKHWVPMRSAMVNAIMVAAHWCMCAVAEETVHGNAQALCVVNASRVQSSRLMQEICGTKEPTEFFCDAILATRPEHSVVTPVQCERIAAVAKYMLEHLDRFTIKSGDLILGRAWLELHGEYDRLNLVRMLHAVDPKEMTVVLDGSYAVLPADDSEGLLFCDDQCIALHWPGLASVAGKAFRTNETEKDRLAREQRNHVAIKDVARRFKAGNVLPVDASLRAALQGVAAKQNSLAFGALRLKQSTSGWNHEIPFGEQDILTFWLSEDEDAVMWHGEIMCDTVAAAAKAEGVWAKLIRDVANMIDHDVVPPSFPDSIRGARVEKRGRILAMTMQLSRADLIQAIRRLLSKEALGHQWPMTKP